MCYRSALGQGQCILRLSDEGERVVKWGENATPFRKELFTSNEIEFDSNLFTNNFRKLEVADVKGIFPILRFAKLTRQNLSILWPVFNLNDITRHVCDVNSLT